MEKGLIFALFSAVSFAASTVSVRRGISETGESFTAVAISVFIGVPFFTAAVLLTREWSKLWSLSGQGFLLLGIAGVIHFVAGRLLSYNAYRLIGANKASTFLQTSPFYAAIFGVVFLNETVTISLILGVLCIFAGVVLVSSERQGVSEGKQRRFSGGDIKGIVAAFGGAVCWGTSPVLIKPAVAEIGSPSAAALVSYVAASIVMVCFLFRREHREQMVQPRFFASLVPLLTAGVFTSIAQLLRYTALNYSPASKVTALATTNNLFVFLFSFLINRKIEVFTVKVALGMLATAIGAFLICY